MSLLFSTETLFTNESIELLTKQNDKNKIIIDELKCENARLQAEQYEILEIMRVIQVDMEQLVAKCNYHRR